MNRRRVSAALAVTGVSAAILVPLARADSASTATAPARPGAAAPAWPLAGWQRGVVIAPQYPTEFGSLAFQQTLRDLKATGANSVSLKIPLFQQGLHTSAVYPLRQHTPPDRSLVAGIRFARSLGLAPILKLHVDIENRPTQARSRIDPRRRAAWFTSYQAQVVHYATLAQAAGATDVSIGTELTTLTRPVNTLAWRNIVRACRRVFHGRLTYGADHGTELGQVAFWDSLDYIGVSAYYPLHAVGRAGLARAWARVDTRPVAGDPDAGNIYPVARKWHRKVVFTEVGYRSGTGAHDEPADYSRPLPYDEQEQAKLYDALFSYWSTRPYMAGVQFWEWHADLGRDWMAYPSDFTSQTTAARDVLRRWFTDPHVVRSPAASIGVPADLPGRPAQAEQPLTVTVTGQPPATAVVRYRVDTARPVAMNPGDGGTWSAVTTRASWPDVGRSPLHSITFELADGAAVLASRTILLWDADLQVTSPTPGPAPRALSAFRARLTRVPLADYRMSWRVGTGAENPMTADPDSAAPSMAACVDTTGWTWDDGVHYVVTFIATTPGGDVVATKDVPVTLPPAEAEATARAAVTCTKEP